MYDLIVIGAGSAGITAVEFAAKLGTKVALVEKNKIGGDCTWSGCVPSKTLLHIAKTIHTSRQAGAFGMEVAKGEPDMSHIKQTIDQVIQSIAQHETAETFSSQGIDVFFGHAQFIDANQLQVGEQVLQSKKFIIVTGARPYPPAIGGLANVPFTTYETIFQNETLPKTLLILGAGAIGIEIGQAYARLGSKVIIIDGVEPLETIDKDASISIKQTLESEGIQFVKGFATAVSYEDQDQFTVQVNTAKFQGDMLLVATGRKPNVNGLGLHEAGIAFSEQGIKVDDKLQTSIPHIFAAGDCTGGFQTTHYAGWQGFQAARNALLPGSEVGVLKSHPIAVFCDPEVAQVGYNEADANARYGDKVRISKRELNRIDRAVMEQAEAGFIKIVYLENGRLIGATVVAPRAGELINEFALAIKHKLTIRDIANTIHAYPTYGMGIQRQTAVLATDAFINSSMGKIIKRLAGLGK